MYYHRCSSKRNHHFFPIIPLFVGAFILFGTGLFTFLPFVLIILVISIVVKQNSKSSRNPMPPRRSERRALEMQSSVPIMYEDEPDHLKPENFTRSNNYCYECGSKVDFDRYCRFCGADLMI